MASSFESEVVSLHAASPTHAPNVASRFNLVRRVAGYKARTRRQMERHVPKQVGSSNNQRPASKRATTERNGGDSKTMVKKRPGRTKTPKTERSSSATDPKH